MRCQAPLPSQYPEAEMEKRNQKEKLLLAVKPHAVPSSIIQSMGAFTEYFQQVGFEQDAMGKKQRLSGYCRASEGKHFQDHFFFF